MRNSRTHTTKWMFGVWALWTAWKSSKRFWTNGRPEIGSVLARHWTASRYESLSATVNCLLWLRTTVSVRHWINSSIMERRMSIYWVHNCVIELPTILFSGEDQSSNLQVPIRVARSNTAPRERWSATACFDLLRPHVLTVVLAETVVDLLLKKT